MDFSDFRITIVGLGLIGGSLAKAIRELKPDKLWAIDKAEETIKTAETMGVIDRTETNCEKILSNSDIVIMALYPEDTVNFIVSNMKFFKSGCIVTDTCGLKSGMLTKLSGILRSDIEFIGGHPMAGKETSGFANAEKEIFYNANYIITPTEQNKEESVTLMQELILAIGCKKPIITSPKEHDEIITYTSHLPHLAAIAMMNCYTTQRPISQFVGGSFRDATRVADINSKLWLELIKLNKENAINVLDCFIDNLSALKIAIRNNDDEKLLQDFLQASSKRKEIC